MIQASKAVTKLSDDQLLDILQNDREIRPDFERQENLKKFEEGVKKMVGEFQSKKEGQGESKPWKFSASVKIGIPPSVSLSFSKEMGKAEGKSPIQHYKEWRAARQAAKEQITPDKALNNQIRENLDRRVLGSVTMPMVMGELDKRGIDTSPSLVRNENSTHLKITDKDFKANGQLRDGIVKSLEKGNFSKVEINATKAVVLPDKINLGNAKIDSNVHIKATELTASSINAPSITANTISARNLDVAKDAKIQNLNILNGEAKIGGRADIKSFIGESITVEKNAEIRNFQGNTINVKGNLSSINIDAKSVNVGKDLAVLNNLKISEKGKVLGKSSAMKITAPSAKLEGKSLESLVNKSAPKLDADLSKQVKIKL